MDERKWKIISIAEDGTFEEEQFLFSERDENNLGVKLINFSGTSMVSMGYYSDITQGYPSLLFPLIYPLFSGVVGICLFFLSFIAFYKKRARKA